MRNLAGFPVIIAIMGILLASSNATGFSSLVQTPESCPLALLRSILLQKLPIKDVPSEHIIRVDMTAMLLTYGAYLKRLEISDNQIYLVTKSGSRIEYDDGKHKQFEEKLNNPDLKDMLSFAYRPGRITDDIPKNYDPGRFRVMQLLSSVYGATEKERRSNLVRVDFCGKKVLFNSQNGAASALERVGAELAALLKKKPALAKYVLPLAGTYNPREIAGTERLSPHALGIAIDLSTERGAYWRWKNSGQDIMALRRNYPIEIILAFEKNGFIWGGKWDHYDLTHFEYRPEFQAKMKLQQAGVFTGSDFSKIDNN